MVVQKVQVWLWGRKMGANVCKSAYVGWLVGGKDRESRRLEGCVM